MATEDGGDAEVGKGVIIPEEVVGDWFVGVVAVDVVSVCSEAGVEGIFGFSNIMKIAAGAGDDVDHVAVGAGEGFSHVEGFFGGVYLACGLCVGSGFAAGIFAGFGACPGCGLGEGAQDTVGEGLAEVAVTAEASQGRVFKYFFGVLALFQNVEVGEENASDG